MRVSAALGVFHVLLRVIFQPSRLSCCKHATLTCGTMAGWGKKFHRPRGGVLRVKRLQAAVCRLQVSRTCAGFRNLELGRGSLFIMVNQPHRIRIMAWQYFVFSYFVFIYVCPILRELGNWWSHWQRYIFNIFVALWFIQDAAGYSDRTRMRSAISYIMFYYVQLL